MAFILCPPRPNSFLKALCQDTGVFKPTFPIEAFSEIHTQKHK